MEPVAWREGQALHAPGWKGKDEEDENKKHKRPGGAYVGENALVGVFGDVGFKFETWRCSHGIKSQQKRLKDSKREIQNRFFERKENYEDIGLHFSILLRSHRPIVILFGGWGYVG
jgi:hypothetical protein